MELIPDGPAVTKEADKTVEATVDTPATQADAKQTERKVEFGMRVALASSAGTMNTEGTEVEGQMTFASRAMALKPRKK